MMTTNNADNSNQDKKLGMYIHVPFCIKKCGYCDFLSFENQPISTQQAYMKALAKEIELHASVYGSEYSVDSIFIGGGTPSMLSPDMVDDVVQTIKNRWNTDADMEMTIEANPKTLSEAKLERYLQSGINRISIGAQSLNDDLLIAMGRVHCAEDISETFQMARKAGFKNINLDLMFAIPRQDMQMWKDTLATAIGLAPEHISFYSLQIEKGTTFYDMFEKGAYEQVTDTLDREMYHFAVHELQGAGYLHYEISNVAKNGYACKHNIKYWTMEDYLGAGIGAHSYIAGERFGNIEDMEAYMALLLENSQGVIAYDRLHESNRRNNRMDDISEYMFTGLRMMTGINLDDFERRFNRPLKEIYSKEWERIEKYIKDDFLTMENDRIRLSKKGIDISNQIMSEFVL